MRYLLTIIAFLLLAESAGTFQLLKWAATTNIFTLQDTTEAEDGGEKKLGENEIKKIDKNLHAYYFSLIALASSQEFYIHNTCLLLKGYCRTVYQPPKFRIALLNSILIN